MATKMRKCDKVQQNPLLPVKECCPICGLPHKRSGVKPFCEFYTRCEKLKYAEGEAESAKMRSEHFRRFHADICPQCFLPREVCKQKRIASYKRKIANLSRAKLRDDPYIEDGEMKKALEVLTCQPPDRSKYTPKIPDWYVEAEPCP